MKRPAILLGLVALALSACGKPLPPVVRFVGHAPYYAKETDARRVEAFCPYCDTKLAWKAAKCPNKKNCGAELKWPDSLTCQYCKGSGACDVCESNRMADFKCFQCKGKGYISVPQTTASQSCPNCESKGACAVCKGTGKCDFCKEGQYSIADKKGVVEEATQSEEPKDGKPN